MISTIRLVWSDRVDPHYNLALEQILLEEVEPGCCTLYLWQNQNTVVIGRNQNAWRECRTTLLEQEGGKLARRLSGGGAVFHDTGNLNFTFLLPTEDFDVRRQLSVIRRACRELGIPAEISGRNDVQAEGRKFSGNAFYQSGGRSYHHGTLLVNVDMEKLSRYLSPSKGKLEAKGVESVRSRVVNLREYVPDLTCQALGRRMESVFEAVYGGRAERISPDSLDGEKVEMIRKRNASWEWLYGARMPFTFTCEGRYAWGELQIMLYTVQGIVQEAKVYSDAMDWSVAPDLERALIGCRFSLGALEEAVQSAFSQRPQLSQDICQLLVEQEI